MIVVSQGWRLLEPKPELVRLQECDVAAIAREARRGPGRPHRERWRRRTGGHRDRHSTRSARRWPFNTPALTTRRSFASSSSAPIASTCRSIPSTPVDSGCSTGRSVPGTIASVATQASGRRTCAAPEDRSNRDIDRLVNRVASLRTLAEATDGLAVVNTNDLAGGARRIVNDLSTYYLLGYQSTNTKLDGRWRVITVRVKTPGVQVRARKGYRALTEAEVALLRSGDAAGRATGTPAAAGQGWRVTGAAAVSRLIEPLAGLDRALRLAVACGLENRVLARAHPALDRVGSRRRDPATTRVGEWRHGDRDAGPLRWPAPRRRDAEARTGLAGARSESGCRDSGLDRGHGPPAAEPRWRWAAAERHAARHAVRHERPPVPARAHDRPPVRRGWGSAVPTHGARARGRADRGRVVARSKRRSSTAPARRCASRWRRAWRPSTARRGRSASSRWHRSARATTCSGWSSDRAPARQRA